MTAANPVVTNEHRSGTSPHNTTHVYDPVGNRLVRESDGSRTTFTHDAANQLVTSEPSTGSTDYNNYTYDKAGNLASVYDGGGAQTRSNTWDNDNRLVKVTPYGESPTTMVYNADGLRVRVASPSESLDKIWDFQTMIAEAQNTNAIRRYASKPGLYGDILHQFGADPTRFYLFDALGSALHLTDTSQTVTDSYLYKAYGEVLASSGSSVNPFQWVGRYGYQYDKITADILQQYVRQRHYSPYSTAWLSRDRFRQSFSNVNSYLYALARPVGLSDPSGLNPLMGGLLGCVGTAAIGAGFEFAKWGLECLVRPNCLADWDTRLCEIGCNAAGNCFTGGVIGALPAGGWVVGCLAGALGSAGAQICKAYLCRCEPLDICDLATIIAVAMLGCFAANAPPWYGQETPIGSVGQGLQLIDDQNRALILAVLGMMLPSAEALCDFLREW